MKAGGITGSRGHSGAKDGFGALVTLPGPGAVDGRNTEVFGCPRMTLHPRQGAGAGDALN